MKKNKKKIFAPAVLLILLFPSILASSSTTASVGITIVDSDKPSTLSSLTGSVIGGITSHPGPAITVALLLSLVIIVIRNLRKRNN